MVFYENLARFQRNLEEDFFGENLILDDTIIFLFIIIEKNMRKYLLLLNNI